MFLFLLLYRLYRLLKIDLMIYIFITTPIEREVTHFLSFQELNPLMPNMTGLYGPIDCSEQVNSSSPGLCVCVCVWGQHSGYTHFFAKSFQLLLSCEKNYQCHTLTCHLIFFSLLTLTYWQVHV